MGFKSFDRTVYTLQSFQQVDVAEWGAQLKEHHVECMGEAASYSQRKAWFDCFNILHREINLMPLASGAKESIYIVFEYELPRERGRRPDVLVLSGKNLIVLEFKGYASENQAQIDQAKHYARDLRNYHERSHELNVIPMLVLAAGTSINKNTEGVAIVSGDVLHMALEPLVSKSFEDINEWFDSEYAPLPTLLQSAQMLFVEKEFPQIKKAQSAGIPQALTKLEEVTVLSQQNNTHHLALITGVAGAGKTLVGLQFVFETYKQDHKQKAVFLSGNGPLVEVLQYSLANRNFVQGVHGFLKQYAHSQQVPSEDVIIYDEAQRAWDSERVGGSKRDGNNAEPTDFTTSLRTHQAITLQTWVEKLLDGQISEAAELSKLLLHEDYPIYITRDLLAAKDHIRSRYSDEPNKTYGLMASSKNKILPQFGVMNDYNSTKSFRVSQYYVDSQSDAYCRNLNSVVTEFACQGLELDMPLLAWDADWTYDKGWVNKAPIANARDSDKLRKNSYRVLLTRGRDGLVIFVPDHRDLTSTFEVLIDAGCKKL